MSTPAASPPPELTPDKLRFASLSCRGLSSRLEMWLSFIALYALSASLCVLPYQVSIAVSTLLFLLFTGPLMVRRARQMGAAWCGVYTTVFTYVLWPIFFLLGSWFPALREPSAVWIQMVVVVCGYFDLVLLFLLFVYGGPLSGRKNALMRAAIDGNAELARQLLATHASMLLQKSEKGYTAREYAERQKHLELAAWLREQELALNPLQQGPPVH